MAEDTQHVVNEEKYPDHLEVDLGGTGRRGKVYFDASKKEEAEERLKNFMDIAKRRDEMLKEATGNADGDN